MQESYVKRFPFIDQVRGLAIVLMVFFHFFYDLNVFKFVAIDFKNNYFWWGLPRVIVFLFLLSVGMSLTLVHYPKIQWHKFNKRLGLLVFFAALISVSTYFLFPKKWIYFGTLHSIATCSLMALPFLRFPRINLAIAILLITPSVILKWNIPWFQLNHFSMDYIPPFPWLGVVCLGVYFTHKNWHKVTPPWNFLTKSLSYLGKHPLKIYILHQPILYGMAYLAHLLMQ